MFKRLLVLLLLIQVFFIKPLTAQYQITDNCKNAWEAIIDLRLKTADSLINIELKTNPTNYYAIYLAQTTDAYNFMISMSEEKYEAIKDKYENRIELLENKDTDSPHYLQCIAELQLQMGMFNIIFGDKLTGLRKAYGSYKKTYRNIEKFPDFKDSYKLDGIFNVAISNLPPFVNWAATTFGVSGDYDLGYKILNNYYKSYSDEIGLSKEAALYNILSFKLNKDPEKAYIFINKLDSSYFNYKLMAYFRANVAYRVGKNEEALSLLSTIDKRNMEIDFNGFNYLSGKIMLRKLDTVAIKHFNVYLDNQKEQQYHKEINYAIAQAYLISGDIDMFNHYKEMALNNGNDIAERDREAMYDCNLDYIPNVNILKAKLSLAGGYLGESKYWLDEYDKNKANNNQYSPYNLEYYLLKGKYESKSKNISDAIVLLEKVIEFGSDNDSYFACEAARQLGFIYEENDPSLAVTYFKLARSLYKSNYYEYIDEISKKRIKILSK